MVSDVNNCPFTRTTLIFKQNTGSGTSGLIAFGFCSRSQGFWPATRLVFDDPFFEGGLGCRAVGEHERTGHEWAS